MTSGEEGSSYDNDVARLLGQLGKFLCRQMSINLQSVLTQIGKEMIKEVAKEVGRPSLLELVSKEVGPSFLELVGTEVIPIFLDCLMKTILDSLEKKRLESLEKKRLERLIRKQRPMPRFPTWLVAAGGGLTVSLQLSLHSVSGEIELLLVEIAGINEQIEELFGQAAGDLRKRVIPMYPILVRKLIQIDNKFGLRFASGHLVKEMSVMLEIIETRAHMMVGEVEDEVVQQLKTLINLIRNKIKSHASPAPTASWLDHII